MKLVKLALLSIGLVTQVMAATVDVKSSVLTWHGKKVAGPHDGTIALKSAKVEFKKKALSSLEVEVDVASITNADVKDPEWNGKLVGHLKGEDFFDAAKYPVATFKSKSVKALSKGEYEVTGDLTIKGVTLPNTFKVAVAEDKKVQLAKGTITIADRTAYNVKYNSGKFFDPKALGDKLIDDTFTVDFNVVIK